jgi:hypothetical protein
MSHDESVTVGQTALPQMPRHQTSRERHDYLLEPEAQAEAGLSAPPEQE